MEAYTVFNSDWACMLVLVPHDHSATLAHGSQTMACGIDPLVKAFNSAQGIRSGKEKGKQMFY